MPRSVRYTGRDYSYRRASAGAMAEAWRAGNNVVRSEKKYAPTEMRITLTHGITNSSFRFVHAHLIYEAHRGEQPQAQAQADTEYSDE